MNGSLMKPSISRLGFVVGSTGVPLFMGQGVVEGLTVLDALKIDVAAPFVWKFLKSGFFCVCTEGGDWGFDDDVGVAMEIV